MHLQPRKKGAYRGNLVNGRDSFLHANSGVKKAVPDALKSTFSKQKESTERCLLVVSKQPFPS